MNARYRFVGLLLLLLGGAGAPDQIQPSAPPPEDFDEFWKQKLAELSAVPPNPKLTPRESDKPGVDYWHVTLHNIRGTHVRGQLARPGTGDKHPALLIVQWAGVYPLEKRWVIDRAGDGWLALNISAHDIPIDEPPEFYKRQLEGPLKEYWSIGNDDRDTSYFLRMYLACYRAADYLASRDDWDGKTLVVLGDSQGGQQSLVTAALHPKITAAIAGIPAGCDMLGPKAGWPQWNRSTAGKDAAKVRNASRYFDVVNFAPRIKCPVLISAGLDDDVCPPEGILAAANQIKSPKEVILMPGAGHEEVDGNHAAYKKRCWEEWLPTLQRGKPAPVKEQ